MIQKISLKEFEFSSYTKNTSRPFLKKISISFGFVIILMPIFGLFMIIGNIINSNVSSESLTAMIFANIGSLLFSNIGLWFALAIVIGFTYNRGVAVYGTILFYLVFITTTSILIIRQEDGQTFNILFWNNLFISMYTSTIFGFLTFNTGIFGGLVCGIVVIFIFNKFKDIKFPKSLEFFAGQKFTLILIPFFALIVGLLFAIIWPLFGRGLISLGEALSNSPVGIDTFIFRMVQRMLIPFGASMIWQAPFWYTSVGGSIAGMEGTLLAIYLQRISDQGLITLNSEAFTYFSTLQMSLSEIRYSAQNGINTFFQEFSSYIILWVDGAVETNIFNVSGDQILSLLASNTNGGLLIQDLWRAGIRTSRYISPGYANSIFVLPSLALIMYFKTAKNKRREYSGMIISAILTTTLLGITEPIEFLFAYTAPFFYFLIYAPLNGFIGYFTTLFEVRASTSFSTGLIDYIFSAVIPWFSGNDTRFYIIPIIGVIAAMIAGIIALFWFKYTSFSLAENNISIKSKIKADIYELLIWFKNKNNIQKIEITNNQLHVVFNRNIDINGFEKWFLSVSNSQNVYIFPIKTDKIQIIEIFANAIKAEQNIKSFKKQNYETYKECLKEYKNWMIIKTKEERWEKKYFKQQKNKIMDSFKE